MKVLQVVGTNYKLGSGIYSIISPLVEKLNEEGVETHVLCTNGDIATSSLPFLYKYGIDFNESDFKKYSLVIFHGIYYIQFVKISKILRHYKINYLIKPHSSLMKASFRKHGIRKFIYLSVFSSFFTKSNGIIYTNEEEKNNSFTFLNKKKFVEMNGIYLIPNELKIRERKSDELQMFFLSRIDISHKGIDILLNGLAELKDFLEKEKCYITFYGKGNEKDYAFFQKKVNEINSQNIVVKGAIFGDEKNQMYALSDIILLTSRYEGFPTVLSETMMYGIPSIVTKGTNGKFISENQAGWYSKTSKSSDVALTIKNAILEYKRNPLYYKEMARKLATEMFDINKTIENTLEIYKSLDNSE